MDKPKAIQPAMAAPQPMVDDLPPWEADGVEPAAVAAVPARPGPRPRGGVSGRRNRPEPAFEAVHWSIVALTAATALSILAGSYGSEPSRPRELLPIVMTAVP